MTREEARQYFISKIQEGYSVLGWSMTEVEARFMNYDLLSDAEAESLENEADEKGIDESRIDEALAAVALDKREAIRYFKALSETQDASLKITVQQALYGSTYSPGEQRMFKIFKWFLIILGLLIAREWLMDYWKSFGK